MPKVLKIAPYRKNVDCLIRCSISNHKCAGNCILQLEYCKSIASSNAMLRTKDLTQMIQNGFTSTAKTINQTKKDSINAKAKGKEIKHHRFFGYYRQRHHIIPIKSLKKVTSLKNDLKLMGLQINDEIQNGICLPMFDEDIFWHDLPRHCGWNSVHSNYNDIILEELEEEFKEVWASLCEEDDEVTVLLEIQRYVHGLITKIKAWNSNYFVYPQGGARKWSKSNARKNMKKTFI